jgi:hypothetical protein
VILLLTCYFLPAAVSDNASTRSDGFDFLEKTKPPRINEWAHDFSPGGFVYTSLSENLSQHDGQ